jgi:ribonuclease HIII
MTLVIAKESFPALKEYLASRGYTFEARPHQAFLARGNGAVINLYDNGKIVLGGSSPDEQKEIEEFLYQAQKVVISKENLKEEPLGFHGTRIGSDEAGKGDYFGPLVACAVMATEEQALRFEEIGVKDSKKLSTNSINDKAKLIRHKILNNGQWKVVLISPAKYNTLMLRMGNLNKVLAWAHARAIEDVLKYELECNLAISDQFGDKRYIEDALMAKGKRIKLIQTPRGERDLVVAAASIIARAEFLNYVESMRKEYKEDFPLGATNVEPFGKKLVSSQGENILLETAKVHFATTGRIVENQEHLHKLIQEREKLTK